MRFLLLTCMSLMLLLSDLHAAQETSSEATGVFSAYYASFEKDLPQTLSAHSTTSITFSNEIVPSSGITHLSDSALFTIDHDGIYWIGWTLSVENLSTSLAIVNTTLQDVTAGRSLGTCPTQTITLNAGETKSISAQILVSIPATHQIELMVENLNGSVTVLGAGTFFMTQTAFTQ